MLIVAFLEAGLAVLFFMHLGSEDRRFRYSIAFLAIFVLLTMQCGRPDSFRMLRGHAPESSFQQEPAR